MSKRLAEATRVYQAIQAQWLADQDDEHLAAEVVAAEDEMVRLWREETGRRERAAFELPSQWWWWRLRDWLLSRV